MKHTLIGTCALVAATLSCTANAAPAATLLFTQPGTQIVGEDGAPRPANRGDVIQTGERLLTPPGAISQLLLPDGSLIGMRPDSEVKITLPTQASDRAVQVVSLVRGAARVIGSELMDARKVSNFTFQSGLATLQLKGADLESAVVRPTGPDNKPGVGVSAAGSYQRLLIGTGSIGNGTLIEPLTPRQVSFVGAVNVAPTLVSSVSPNLFTASRAIDPMALAAPLPTKPTTTVAPITGTLASYPTVLAPTLMTSTLTSPLRVTSVSPTLAIAQPQPVYSPISTTLVQPTATPVTTALVQPVVVAAILQPVVAPIAIAPILQPVIAPIVIAPILQPLVIAPIYVYKPPLVIVKCISTLTVRCP